MSSLPALKYRALDSNGDPISGAKLYFYEAGTVTPLDTYSDEALASANANPVVADANGYFGEIYGKTDQTYKVKLTDADDVEIFEVDDISFVVLTSADLVERVGQIASNPLDYGAVGDGVADESTEVQAAIDAATGVVDLLGKTYRCDTMITIPSGVTLRNGDLDFSNSTDDSYVRAQGTRGSGLTLSGNAAAGDQQVSLTSVSGLAAGDTLTLSSTATVGETTGHAIGEIVKIQSISSLDVLLNGAIDQAYATADSALVEELTTVKDVRIENVTITGSISASGVGTLLDLNMCERVRVAGCRFVGWKGDGLRVNACLGIWIDDCQFDQAGTPSGASAALEIDGATRDVWIDGCEVIGAKNGVRVGQGAVSPAGQARFVTVRDCQFSGCTIGVLLMDNAVHASVVDSSFSGMASNGIRADCAAYRLFGNTIRECGAAGIESIFKTQDGQLSAMPGRVSIVDNDVRDCDGDGISFDPGASAVYGDVDISGNTIVGATAAQKGISVDLDSASQATDFKGIRIDRNHIEVAGEAVDVSLTVAQVTLPSLSVSGNVIKGGAGYDAINLSVGGGAVADIGVSNNQITGSGVNAIDLATASLKGLAVVANNTIRATLTGCGITGYAPIVTGNTLNGTFGDSPILLVLGGMVANNTVFVSDATTAGIEFGNGSGDTAGIVSGNRVSCSGSGTMHGIMVHADGVSSTNGVVVLGNSVLCTTPGDGNCIRVEGAYEQCAVVGNICDRSGTIVPIALVGDGAGDIAGAVVSGNVARSEAGAHGATISNGSSSVVDGLSAPGGIATSTGFTVTGDETL